MEQRINYMTVLLRNGLNIKKKDSLFISVQGKYKYMAIELEYIARAMGIEDIHIFYNDLEKPIKMAEYVEKRAKFLFFLDNDVTTLNMRMINDLINNDIGIDYTVANLPTFESEIDKEIYTYSSISATDSVIEWNKLISTNHKLVSQIKNLKLNSLKIENLNDTNLRMELTSGVFGNSEINKMRLFPSYKVEIIPREGTANGYIEATSPVVINDKIVEDLRLVVKNGRVIDYDCNIGANEVKQFFYMSFNPVIEAIGLIDKGIPTYDRYTLFKNIVLDRTSKPYIAISSYDSINDEKNYIYVPIASGLLKVVGQNSDGKKIPLYEHETFSKKILIKK